jgi:hypothetical protein
VSEVGANLLNRLRHDAGRRQPREPDSECHNPEYFWAESPAMEAFRRTYRGKRNDKVSQTGLLNDTNLGGDLG